MSEKPEWYGGICVTEGEKQVNLRPTPGNPSGLGKRECWRGCGGPCGGRAKEMATEAVNLRNEIERLKKQLIAESVCRQPEECGKYDWLIEERNAEIASLNDKLKASENKFHHLKMFIVDVVAHLRDDVDGKEALIMNLEEVLK